MALTRSPRRNASSAAAVQTLTSKKLSSHASTSAGLAISQAVMRRIIIYFQCDHQAKLRHGARQEGVPGSAVVQWWPEAWGNKRDWLRINDMQLQWLFEKPITQHTDHSCQQPDNNSMQE
jgi:hypothetical protein